MKCLQLYAVISEGQQMDHADIIGNLWDIVKIEEFE